jgi:hypothetical protein
MISFTQEQIELLKSMYPTFPFSVGRIDRNDYLRYVENLRNRGLIFFSNFLFSTYRSYDEDEVVASVTQKLLELETPQNLNQGEYKVINMAIADGSDELIELLADYCPITVETVLLAKQMGRNNIYLYLREKLISN